jgi:hypothetical protein
MPIMEPSWCAELAGGSAGSFFGSNVSSALQDTAARATSRETKLKIPNRVIAFVPVRGKEAREGRAGAKSKSGFPGDRFYSMESSRARRDEASLTP